MGKRRRSSAAGEAAPSVGAQLPWAQWLALLLVVAGLILSVVLTRNYYQHVLAGQVSGCSISAYVDCDRISASQFSAVAGVPISAVALAAYVVLGGLLAVPLAAGLRASAAACLKLATLLAGAGALVSVGLALLSALVIGALCLYCALLQLTTVGLFAVLLRLRAQPRPSTRSGKRRPERQAFAPAAGAVAAGVAVALAATLGFEAEALSTGTRAAASAALQQAGPSFLSRQTHTFASDGVPGVGPADAPVQIMVFGDYNCSHCRSFDPEALRLATTFPDEVRVLFKFYPLDGTCNRAMGNRTSTSCLAAAAAYAAHQQGRFVEYHQLLYEHFQNHRPQQLLDNAATAGVADSEAFLRDLQSEAAMRHIQRDVDEGHRSGVDRTPTVFVNGRRLETDRFPQGASRYVILVQEIRSLLRARLS